MPNLEKIKIKKIVNFFSYTIFLIYIFILYLYREKIFEGFESINSINNRLLIVIICLIIASIFIKGIKFALVNSFFGLREIQKTIVIFCSSFFLCLAPGKLVELYRVKLISEQKNSSLPKSIYINIFDKFTDFICLGIYGIIGLILFLPNLLKIIIIEKIYLMILIAILIIFFIGIIVYLLLKKISEKLKKILSLISNKKRNLLIILLFTFIGWAQEIISFYYLFSVLVNTNLEFYLITSFYTVANVMGGFIPLPAGAIGFEGTLIYLLSHYLPISTLASIIFIHRTTVIGTTFFTGFLFFFYKKIINFYKTNI